MGAFDCQVGDTVNITNSRMGWSNKTYQVIDWGFDINNEDGSLQITAQFKETASAVYNFSTSDYSTVSSGKATNLPSANTVSPPQAVTLTDELVSYNDGTVIVKLVINLTEATDNFTEIYEVEIKQLLNNMLDEHVEEMPKPKWPQSVYMPVTTDIPITDYKDGDDLIYWPN